MEDRPIAELPKAHLHLHLTGSMRHPTLVELARRHRVHLPDSLANEWPPRLRTAAGRPRRPGPAGTDERGWFRFQRLYDIARSVLRTGDDVRRLLREAAEDDAAEGSGWLEIQIDPSGYAARFGGLSAFTDLVVDAAREASTATGVGIGVIIAASRVRHPLDARTLARLAAQYTGRGVVGFGLSNDERRGRAHDFDGAFRIAKRAGLLSVPHGGELLGPASVRACLDSLRADRIGHGVRAADDPALLDTLAGRGVTLEVCPSSNVGLGVYATPGDVPLRRLTQAGVPVALGADDPLLFGSRLVRQYELARTAHGFTDQDLAELARHSIRASAAPSDVRDRLLRGVDAWGSRHPGGRRPPGCGVRDVRPGMTAGRG